MMYPDKNNTLSRTIDSDVENMRKKIKLKTEDPTLTEYYNNLMDLQLKAIKKGLSRGWYK